MKSKFVDDFFRDEDRAAAIVIWGAAGTAVVVFVLAIAAMVWMK